MTTLKTVRFEWTRDYASPTFDITIDQEFNVLAVHGKYSVPEGYQNRVAIPVDEETIQSFRAGYWRDEFMAYVKFIGPYYLRELRWEV